MLRKWLVACTAILFLLPAAACVSKADYDTLAQERDTLRTQVASLQADVNTANANKEAIKPILTRLNKEVKASAVLISFLSKSMNLYSTGGQAADYGAVGSSFIMDFGSAVNDVNDAQLSQTWKDMIQALGRQDAKVYIAKFTDMVSQLSKMIDSDVAAIQTKVQ